LPADTYYFHVTANGKGGEEGIPGREIRLEGAIASKVFLSVPVSDKTHLKTNLNTSVTSDGWKTLDIWIHFSDLGLREKYCEKLHLQR